MGLARQGTALARHFAALGAEVVVTDQRPPQALAEALASVAGLPLEFHLGGHPESILAGADLLCLSGGVPADLPLAQQARRLGIEVSNDSQLFLEACPAATVGITGSAGKSTTTALLGEMARRAVEGSSRKAWVGGNIGRPLLADLAEIRPGDLVVLELSSFQLELMRRSPSLAIVLNLSHDHLDRHGTLEAYRAAKARILDFQASGDTAVLAVDDPEIWALRSRVRGRLHGFGRALPPGVDGATLSGETIVLRSSGADRPVGAVASVRLAGQHNLANVLAACAAADVLGIPKEAMAGAITDFRGLPHRLELVRRHNGAAWYDDSIATTPERSRAALLAFDQPLVLLAGGRDKGLDWAEWAELVRRRVDHLVAFGQAAEMIAAAVGEPGPSGRLRSVDIAPGLEQAVARAAERAEEGDVVLLAPGATSFDEFADFAARGERFAAWVRAL